MQKQTHNNILSQLHHAESAKQSGLVVGYSAAALACVGKL